MTAASRPGAPSATFVHTGIPEEAFDPRISFSGADHAQEAPITAAAKKTAAHKPPASGSATTVPELSTTTDCYENPLKQRARIAEADARWLRAESRLLIPALRDALELINALKRAHPLSPELSTKAETFASKHAVCIKNLSY